MFKNKIDRYHDHTHTLKKRWILDMPMASFLKKYENVCIFSRHLTSLSMMAVRTVKNTYT